MKRKSRRKTAALSHPFAQKFAQVHAGHGLRLRKSLRHLEARAGIEPATGSFADSCLTTWLPRRSACNLAR